MRRHPAQFEKEQQRGLSFALSLGGAGEDIQLTGDQHFELVGLSAMTKMQLQKAFLDYRANYSEDLPKDEKQRLDDQLAAAIEKVRKNEMQQLEMVLKPAQIERLKQIRFQFLRRNSIGLESIRDELDLSDQQLAKIELIGKQMITDITEMRESTRDLRLTPIEITDHILQIRKNSEESLLTVLTPAQRQKLRALEGEEFQFQVGFPVPSSDDEDGEDKE